MTPEAQDILDVFRQRGIRSGGLLHPTEFGDAIVWEDGFVRDEAVREALGYLFEEEYLIEWDDAFELAVKGARELYPDAGEWKFGARVYRIDGELLIKQAELRGVPAEYLIDELRERRVAEDDDVAIATAVRDAVAGRL